MTTREQIRAKRQENAADWAIMEALLKKRHDEKRAAFSADEELKFKTADEAFEARGKEIEALETQHDRELKHAERQAALDKLDKRHAGRDTAIPESLRGDGKHETEESRAFEHKLFDTWVRRGLGGLDAEQREVLQKRDRQMPAEIRALSASSGSGSAGGYIVAQSFMPELETALRAYAAILQGCRVIRTQDGSDLPWPKVDDTANAGALLSENTQAASNTDPTFASVTLKSYIYTSKIVLVPLTLLQDADIDIEGFLFDALANRLGRAFNTAGTTGSGSSQPRGLITALAADIAHPFTLAGASAITYADMVNLFHKVDPAYRTQKGCGWMFHDNILATLKQIMDSNGRPLFMPAMEAPAGIGTILGFPYVINQDMASSVATTNKTLVFGQLQKYVARMAGPSIVMRLAERYADSFQVGFVCFQRFEGQLVTGATGDASNPTARLAIALGQQA